MSKGRPTLFGSRLKANGTSEELDAWFHAEAKRRTESSGERVTVAALKRLALEAYRTQCELNTPIETFRVDTTAEPDSAEQAEADNSGEVEL